MKKVLQYFQEIGLTDKQASVYLGLLEMGPTTIQNLSKYLKLQRPTVHTIVGELIEKGLIYQTKKGARRQIVADNPRKLERFIEEKIQRSQGLKDDFEEIINIINLVKNEDVKKSGIDFKYYEGEEAVQNLYQETLVGDENYAFVNLDKYYEVYPGTQTMFKESYKRNKKRRVWDIAVDSPLSRKVLDLKIHGYHSRFISSPNLNFGFDIQIYDDKVALIQLEKGNVAAVVIESPLIYMVMKMLHKTMWAKLENE